MTTTDTSNQVKMVLAVITVLAVTLTIYWNGLNGPLILDDHPQLGSIIDNVSEPFSQLLRTHIVSNSGPLKRPVAMSSFVLNAYFFGRDIWWWKFTNVVLHLLSGMVVFLLMRKLLARFDSVTNNFHQWIPLLITCFWLLHPLQVSTVLYTVQRMTELASLFSLLGMLVYIIGREHIQNKQNVGWMYIATSYMVCLPLAAFSKETGLLLLLYLGLIEVMCFSGDKSNGSPRREWRYLIPALLSLIVGGLYLIVNFNNIVIVGYEAREYTFLQHLMTEWRVLVIYILQTILPVHSTMGFFHDDILVSQSLSEPISTIASLLFLVMLVILAWYSRNIYQMVTFGILFFFIGHLLESSIFPLDLMYEHRNYLPMLGVIIATMSLFSVIYHRIPFVQLILGATMATLAMLTFYRVDAWSSSEKLYPHLYSIHPRSERLIAIIGNNYAENGDYRTAYALLGKLDTFAAKVNMGYLLCKQNHTIDNKTFIALNNAMPPIIDDYSMTGLIKIANLGLDNQCEYSINAFMILIDKVLQQKFKAKIDKQKIMLYKAHLFHQQKQFNDALKTLDIIISHQPSDPIPLLLSAQWLKEVGQVEQAKKRFQHALRLVEASRINYSVQVNQTREIIEATQRDQTKVDLP